MIVAVYVPLVLPLLAVPVVRWAGNRLPPAWASWLVVVSSTVLALCSTAALGMLMIAALSMLGPFARLGHWSPATVQRLDDVHMPVNVAASVLLVVLLGNGVRVAIRRILALRDAHRTAARDVFGSALLVLRDSRPIAYALPGRPGRIVVSAGMLNELAPAERRALLAHERAHLTNGHHMFVVVADVLAAFNPLLRPLTSVVRYTTERWADESAADVVGDRRIVARAVGKAALAGAVAPPSAVALGATTGPVPRRVGALLAARPQRSGIVSVTGLCATVACVLVATSFFASVEALADLQHAAELAQYQPPAVTRDAR